MRIASTKQLKIEELCETQFDLVIMSSGFESRARFLCELFKLNGDKKIVLCFDNYEENEIRKKNDALFQSKGYTQIICSGDSENEIQNELHFLVPLEKEIINILIDYSSMTRIWYAALLKFISANKFYANNIQIYFSYSFSEFSEPSSETIYNRHVGPIEGFYKLSIPNKPTAVLIGLGYIESRAYGLAEYFDVDPYIFIADGSASEDFYNYVIDNNEELLKYVKKDNIFKYPLNNLVYSETLLSQVCDGLEQNYRIILAPCGPKPFTLLSLITALRKDYVDVWRISAGKGEQPIDKKPSGKTVVYCVSFSDI